MRSTLDLVECRFPFLFFHDFPPPLIEPEGLPV